MKLERLRKVFEGIGGGLVVDTATPTACATILSTFRKRVSVVLIERVQHFETAKFTEPGLDWNFA